jgi:beta-alanine degradation protein BauB
MSSVPKPEVTTYPDAISADPQHYQILYEDENIRVLRVQYGAQEESVMHGHPSTILIPLKTSKLRLTDYNGRIDVLDTRAWQVVQTSVGIHKRDNLADTPFEAIAIELKYVRPVSIRGSQRLQ